MENPFEDLGGFLPPADPDDVAPDEGGETPGALRPLGRDVVRAWLDDLEQERVARQGPRRGQRLSRLDYQKKVQTLYADIAHEPLEQARRLVRAVEPRLQKGATYSAEIMGRYQRAKGLLASEPAIQAEIERRQSLALTREREPGSQFLAGEITRGGDTFRRYGQEEELRAQFERALTEEFGQGGYELRRVSSYRYQVKTGKRNETITLDPLLRAPVVQGKFLVPAMGQDHMTFTAQALHADSNFRAALETGLNLNPFSPLTQTHVGGHITHAQLAMLASLRQVGPALKLYYGDNEQGPKYAFAHDKDLVALASNLKGSESGDFDENATTRGMMAFRASEVFPEWLGFGVNQKGNLIVPVADKAMGRGKLFANTRVRQFHVTDLAAKPGDSKVGYSAARPASGNPDPEIIANALYAPHYFLPPGQIDVAEKLAGRVVLSRSHLKRQNLDWEELTRIRLPEATGTLRASNFVPLYINPSIAGEDQWMGFEDTDATQVSLDANKILLPTAPETGHWLERIPDDEGRALSARLHKKFGNATLAQWLQMDPNRLDAKKRESYFRAVERANQILDPFGYRVTSELGPVGSSFRPQLVAEYRAYEYLRHGTKLQGSGLIKGMTFIKSRLARANRPEVVDAADLIISGEPIKGPEAYIAGLQNLAARNPDIARYLGQQFGLKMESGGFYRNDERTWSASLRAAEALFQKGLGDKATRALLKQWGVLHENVALTRRMSPEDAAAFLPGGAVYESLKGAGRQYTAQEVKVKGKTFYDVTTPADDVLLLPTPISPMLTVPDRGYPAQVNFSDLARLDRSRFDTFSYLFQSGERNRDAARQILYAAANVLPSAEEFDSGRVVKLTASPDVEKEARDLEEAATGRRPQDQAAPAHYLQALAARYGERELYLERGHWSARLPSAATAQMLANFDLEGENNAAVAAHYLRTLRSYSANDATTLAAHYSGFRAEIRTLAQTRAVRKGLFGGKLENAWTHAVLGATELPPGVVVSGYANEPRFQRLGSRLSALVHRWPASNDEQSLPVRVISPEKANELYGLDMSTDPRFGRRNVAVNPTAASGVLRQMDYDGDTAMLAFLVESQGRRERQQAALNVAKEVRKFGRSPESAEPGLVDRHLRPLARMVQTMAKEFGDQVDYEQLHLMTWLHDYPKLLGDRDDFAPAARLMAEAGVNPLTARAVLAKLGEVEALKGTDLTPEQRAGVSLEARVLSTADALSHYVGDRFWQAYADANSQLTPAQIAAANAAKLEKDRRKLALAGYSLDDVAVSQDKKGRWRVSGNEAIRQLASGSMIRPISSLPEISPVHRDEILLRGLIASNVPQEEIEAFRGQLQDPQTRVKAWQRMAEVSFGGRTPVPSKLKDLLSGYIGQAGTISGNVGKLIERALGGLDTPNTAVMDPVFNEAWSKAMTGSTDYGIEGLMGLIGEMGLTDPKATGYLSRALALGVKPITIDKAGALDLDQMASQVGWLRPNLWKNQFHSGEHMSNHLDTVMEFLEGAKKAGVHLEDLEPLLRKPGRMDERNEAVYRYLYQGARSDKPLRGMPLFQALAGVDSSTQLDVPAKWAAVQDTVLSRYGRALSFLRTKNLVENEEPTDVTPWVNELDDEGLLTRRGQMAQYLTQRGIRQAPAWYVRLHELAADPARLKFQPIGEARRRLDAYLQGRATADPEGVLSFWDYYSRRAFAGNADPAELQKGGLGGYLDLLGLGQNRRDLLGRLTRSRLAGFLAAGDAGRDPGDIGLTLSEFLAAQGETAAKVREILAKYGVQGLDQLSWDEKSFPSTHLIAPSQLKGLARFQDMVEGSILRWGERDLSFDDQAQQRTGSGRFFHNLLEEKLRQEAKPGVEMEKRVVYTGAGVVVQGAADVADLNQGTVMDFKFVNSDRLQRLKRGKGQLDELEAQVISYLLGLEEMTGKPFTAGALRVYNREQAEAGLEKELLQSGYRARGAKERIDEYFAEAQDEFLQQKRGDEFAGIGRRVLDSTAYHDFTITRSPEAMERYHQFLTWNRLAAYVGERTGLSFFRPIVANLGQMAEPDPSRRADYLASAMAKHPVIQATMEKLGFTYQEPAFLTKAKKEAETGFDRRPAHMRQGRMQSRFMRNLQAGVGTAVEWVQQKIGFDEQKETLLQQVAEPGQGAPPTTGPPAAPTQPAAEQVDPQLAALAELVNASVGQQKPRGADAAYDDEGPGIQIGGVVNEPEPAVPPPASPFRGGDGEAGVGPAVEDIDFKTPLGGPSPQKAQNAALDQTDASGTNDAATVSTAAQEPRKATPEEIAASTRPKKKAAADPRTGQSGPVSASEKVTRFKRMAKRLGVEVRENEQLDGPYTAETTNDRLIRLSQAVAGDDSLTRYHELGHILNMRQFPLEKNVPSTMMGNLGRPDLGARFDEQLETARLAIYGRELTDSEAKLPTEMAADAIGMLLEDPRALLKHAPDVFLHTQRYLSAVAPSTLEEAGIPVLDVSGGLVDPSLVNMDANAREQMSFRLGEINLAGQRQNTLASMAANSQTPGQQAAGGVNPKLAGGAMGQTASNPFLSGVAAFARDQHGVSSFRGGFKNGQFYLFGEAQEQPDLDAMRDAVDKTTQSLQEFEGWVERTTDQMKKGVYDPGKAGTTLNKLEKLANALEKGLPNYRSYQWDDSLESHKEVRGALKTTGERLARVKDRIDQAQYLATFGDAIDDILDLEDPAHYRGGPPRRGRGGGSGSGGGGGGDRTPGVWGRFTDELGGVAGLGWAGFAAFSLGRVKSLLWGGIKEDVGLYNTTQLGLARMQMAQQGLSPSLQEGAIEHLTSNAFVKNWAKYQAGKNFQGLQFAVDDFYNNLFTTDQQAGIETVWEGGKGVVGAILAGLISAYAGKKLFGNLGRLGKPAIALSALAGSQAAAQEGGSPIDAVMTGLEVTMGARWIMDQMGGAPLSQGPGGPGRPLGPGGGLWGKVLGKLGPLAPLAGLAGRALGGAGAAWGGLALGEAAGRGLNQYTGLDDAFHALGRRLLGEPTWEGLRNAPFGWEGQWYDPLLGGAYWRDRIRETRGEPPGNRGGYGAGDEGYGGANAEKRRAREAFLAGDISELGIRDNEGLVKQLGLAATGADPADVADLAAAFMRTTGQTVQTLTQSGNPAVKLLYDTISSAVQQGINPTAYANAMFGQVMQLGFSPQSMVGLNLAGQIVQMSGAKQELLNTGISLLANFDTAKVPLSAQGRLRVAQGLGDLAAQGYSFDQIGRAQALISPTTPYTYNLALAKGVVTPQSLGKAFGVNPANIGMTMDLTTGLPIHQEKIWGVEDQMRAASWNFQLSSFDYQETSARRNLAQQKEIAGLSWNMTQVGFDQAMAGMERQITQIQNNLGRQLAQKEVNWRQMQEGFRHSEAQLGFQERQLAMGYRHSTESLNLQEQQTRRSFAMQMAERALARQEMVTRFRHAEEEFAVEAERRPVARQWQDEDRAYARDLAGVQFGWQVEDLRRGMRMATGRQKVEYRRQLERAQVLYGMQEGQRNKEEERLQTQRKWEDEDFERKKSHYEELKALQIAQFNLQTEHLQESHQMQLQQLAQRRAQLEEQHALAVEMHAEQVRHYHEEKALSIELYNLQIQHMKEAAAEDIANIRARQAEMKVMLDLQKAMHDKQLEHMQADFDAWLAFFKKQKDHAQEMHDLEEERIRLTREQERLIAAMNLILVAWNQELIPEILALVNEIVKKLQEAGSSLPPLGPSDRGPGGLPTPPQDPSLPPDERTRDSDGDGVPDIHDPVDDRRPGPRPPQPTSPTSPNPAGPPPVNFGATAPITGTGDFWTQLEQFAEMIFGTEAARAFVRELARTVGKE